MCLCFSPLEKWRDILLVGGTIVYMDDVAVEMASVGGCSGENWAETARCLCPSAALPSAPLRDRTSAKILHVEAVHLKSNSYRPIAMFTTSTQYCHNSLLMAHGHRKDALTKPERIPYQSRQIIDRYPIYFKNINTCLAGKLCFCPNM
jgi:hypothetical protein